MFLMVLVTDNNPGFKYFIYSFQRDTFLLHLLIHCQNILILFDRNANGEFKEKLM